MLVGKPLIARRLLALCFRAFRGAAFAGRAFRGAAFTGRAFRGAAFRGAAFRGDAFRGAAFTGRAFRGDAFRGAGEDLLRLEGSFSARLRKACRARVADPIPERLARETTEEPRRRAPMAD